MEWENRKVLVNGITGFIGSNIGRALHKKGAKIYSIDNFSYIDSEIAKRKLSFLKDVEIIGGDVSSSETWKRVPEDVEYIFNFAAPSSITLFKRGPEKALNETVLGMWQSLEFAKKNNVKKVIYPSTGSLYAGNKMPHDEKVYPRPRNLYAAAKVSCEGLANSYSDFVKSVGLRIFAGYGPGEEWKKDFGSVLYLFLRDYLNGDPPEIWGDGSQTRDFVYIEDIVKIALKSAGIDYTGVVNVGTGNAISFRELLNIIKEVVGADIDPVFVPKDKNYVENLEADTTLMKELFDIKPISPKEGIGKYADYLRASS